MVSDPYQVLGVEKGATKEEIKKTYRKKAKECHPDLHPDDPGASRKMNEVNEAYDMLMNPEKYEARRTQQQRQSYGQGQQYGGYSGSGQGNYGNNQGSGYGGGQNSSGTYRGPGGWSSDFGGFGFEDIFGFGFERQDEAPVNPQVEPGDSTEFKKAVSQINGKQYQEAISVLTGIPGAGRNARWYYLSSLANHGLGNTVQAIGHMQRAVQMDPNNRTYHQLLQRFRRSEQTYERNAQGFNTEILKMQRLCLGCMAMQCLCGPFGCPVCYV